MPDYQIEEAGCVSKTRHLKLIQRKIEQNLRQLKVNYFDVQGKKMVENNSKLKCSK